MSILSSIQQQCADRLQADPLFANVPVLTERIRDIESEIARALGPLNDQNGRTGLVAIILTPTANVNFENVFGPFFDDIKIVVRVIENVPVNQDANTGTNVAAADAAEKVCSLLHHFQPDNANGPVTAQKPSVALGNDPNYLSYDCRFKTSGGLTSVAPQAATPVITQNSGVYSIACATAGAAIFYALDGSNPMPRNGALYTASFTCAPGLTLKARAFLAVYPPLLGAAVTTIQVELSNQYTLEQLDADATQLLNAVDTDAMPWSSLVFAAYNEFQTVVGPSTPAGFLNGLLPDFAEYDEVAGPGPIQGESTILYNTGSDAAVAFGPIPYAAIKSAAFAVYALGYVGATSWFPNGCIKLKSVIAMAGNYCEKTFAIDDDLNGLGQTCQSGQGQCSAPFNVNPGPLSLSQNSYTLIVPNCQCESS
jgi:hypothetical protein